MRRNFLIEAFLCLALGAVGGMATGYLTAKNHKPADKVTNITTKAVAPSLHAGPGAALNVSRADARALAVTWPGLEQGEINALTAALKDMPKTDLVVYCQDDAKCGDLQMDFENALESAHWPVKTDSLLVDGTIGVAASTDALRDAINKATAGRLHVTTIQANTPFAAIIIGRKPRA